MQNEETNRARISERNYWGLIMYRHRRRTLESMAALVLRPDDARRKSWEPEWRTAEEYAGYNRMMARRVIQAAPRQNQGKQT